MGWYERHSLAAEPIVVRGRMENVSYKSRKRDFVTSANELVAQQGAILGLAAFGGGGAAGVASMSNDRFEKGTYIGFTIDGQKFEGWLWHVPFEPHDEVEAVAIPSNSQAHEVIALRRVDDQLICVYPHATAGRRAHMKRVLTYSFLAWLIIGGIGCAWMFWGWYGEGPLMSLISVLSGAAAIFYVLLLFIGYMVGRRFRPCILIAEQTFRALGKTDFKSVDLQTSNYRLRRGGEPKSYGFQVFRLV